MDDRSVQPVPTNGKSCRGGGWGVHFDSLNRPFCSVKRKKTNLQFKVTMLFRRNYFTTDPQRPHFGVFLGKLPRDLGK